MHFLNYYASFTAVEGVVFLACVEPVGRVELFATSFRFIICC